jgi:predicted Zn finger-like uncharacterized protein
MALATRCPHCHTTFRVVPDQLKLRAGLVRCGACKEIFNGIENLLPPEVPPTAPPQQPQNTSAATDQAPSAASPPSTRETKSPAPAVDAANSPSPGSTASLTPSTPGAAAGTAMPFAPVNGATNPPAPATSETAKPVAAEDTPAHVDFSEFLAAREAQATASAAPDQAGEEQPAMDDPLLRMTLMDFSDRHMSAEDAFGHRQPIAADDRLDQVIDDLKRKPDRRTRHAYGTADVTDDDPEEPNFVRSARRKQQFGPILNIMTAVGVLLLLLALIAQAGYAFRHQLAATYPAAKPVLVRTCALIGCRIDLPMQIDALSIESNELQAIPDARNLYTLSTVLRNRSTLALRWPNIELTLNDTQDTTLARRIFTPSEYLAAPLDPDQGFAPGTEQPVQLTFTLEDIDPAGYRVYLFYP